MKTKASPKHLLSLLLALMMVLTLLPTAALATDPSLDFDSEGRFHAGFVGLTESAGTIELDTENNKITMTAGNDSGSSGGKLADSEDRFLYYYREVAPDTENFTLTGTFMVKDATQKDNQSGFGVMAVDTFKYGDSEHRYFNSAGCMVRKYIQTVNGAPVNKHGIPGGYFVTGYTGTTNPPSGSSKTIDTAAFDWDAASFDTDSVYTLTLKKDNTGFHAIMDVDGDTDPEVLCYEPELLLQQVSDKYYVGFAVACNITVEISNIQFSTSNPETDPVGIPRPPTPVTPNCNLTTASTSPSADYEAGFIADYKGTLAVYDSSNNLVVGDITVDPTSGSFIATADLTLAKGVNEFYAVFTPSPDSEQGGLLGENETIDPEQTIRVPFTVSYQQYGTSDNCIYVSNSGSSTGTGSKNSPLDIYTAVAYAQPGQEIVLAGGTYNLTKPIDIERGHDGTTTSPITIMSDPDSENRAVLDGAGYYGNIINLSGDYWHLYDLEVKKAKNNCKGVQISGNHNIVEKLTVHDCGSTGIQISGNAMEPRSLWPANNLVLSCESYNNCDLQENDADGFAAKLTVGEGNVFRYCIARHNINDGWELYAKATTGAIGVVTIDQCVAYANGKLTDGTENTETGEGNGFKLGGDGVSVAHQLTNSIAYNNRNNGVYSNTNPGCQITNVTSYANGCNLKLNATTATTTTTWLLDGFISHGVAGTADGISVNNQATLLSPTNYLDGANSAGIYVTDDWFESLDTSIVPTIAQDGSIDMHGLLTLTGSAPFGVGAVIGDNDYPTVILPGSEMKIQKTITASAAANLVYNGSAQAGYAGTPVVQDAVIAASDLVYSYTGRNGTTYNNSATPVNAGDYTLVISIPNTNASYAGSTSIDFTIAKATITITAKSLNAKVGDAVPTLAADGYIVAGLAAGESLLTPPALAFAAAPDMTKTGITAIKASGAAAPAGGNYNDISYVDGQLTVSAPSNGLSTYTLTFNTNGGSSISPIRRARNTSVDLTDYTPTKDDYDFDGWYSDSELTTKVTSIKLTRKTTVYAKWTEKIVIPEMPFTDVPEDAYYRDAVLWAVGKGITEGTGDGTTFSPNDSCTRAQMATFLWRAAGSPEPTATVDPFADVTTDSYYYKAVLWAVEKGITLGTNDDGTTFSPIDTCTRGQMATFLYRYADSPAVTGSNPFADVTASDYYGDAVNWAADKGVTEGTNEAGTTFSPKEDCTRAQIVMFLYRYLAK